MSDYLTDAELSAFNTSQKKIQAGDVAFNGHIFNVLEAAAYNAFLYDLNREKHKPTRDFLLNQRHKLFCSITGMMGF